MRILVTLLAIYLAFKVFKHFILPGLIQRFIHKKIATMQQQMQPEGFHTQESQPAVDTVEYTDYEEIK